MRFDRFWGMKDQKYGAQNVVQHYLTKQFGNETQDDEEVYRFFFDASNA